jgi:hypothetical protein
MTKSWRALESTSAAKAEVVAGLNVWAEAQTYRLVIVRKVRDFRDENSVSSLERPGSCRGFLRFRGLKI